MIDPLSVPSMVSREIAYIEAEVSFTELVEALDKAESFYGELFPL